MSLCGYHLRCLNYGENCANCEHNHMENAKDYLHDKLNVWPKGKDSIFANEDEQPNRL